MIQMAGQQTTFYLATYYGAWNAALTSVFIILSHRHIGSGTGVATNDAVILVVYAGSAGKMYKRTQVLPSSQHPNSPLLKLPLTAGESNLAAAEQASAMSITADVTPPVS